MALMPEHLIQSRLIGGTQHTHLQHHQIEAIFRDRDIKAHAYTARGATLHSARSIWLLPRPGSPTTNTCGSPRVSRRCAKKCKCDMNKPMPCAKYEWREGEIYMVNRALTNSCTRCAPVHFTSFHSTSLHFTSLLNSNLNQTKSSHILTHLSIANVFLHTAKECETETGLDDLVPKDGRTERVHQRAKQVRSGGHLPIGESESEQDG
jgi:hypothetical protein